LRVGLGAEKNASAWPLFDDGARHPMNHNALRHLAGKTMLVRQHPHGHAIPRPRDHDVEATSEIISGVERRSG